MSTASESRPGGPRGAGRRGSRRAALLLLTAALVPACSLEDEGGGEVEQVLVAIERLAFVPRGETQVSTPVVARAREDLLVDRFEVTWACWDRHAPEDLAVPEVYRPRDDDGEPADVPRAWRLGIPATGMTLPEARRLASVRGMRLPSFEEWMWCALGPRGRRVPSGEFQRGAANTVELGLGRPTPAGAFESGRTPDFGLYDLLGNVWEWIDAPPDPSLGLATIDVATRPEESLTRAPAWCLGGSFLVPERPTFTNDRVCLALGLEEGHRASDLGMRCVAPARAFLAALPEASGLSRRQRERLRRVGRRWGATAERALSDSVDAGMGLPWARYLLEGAAQ